MGLDHWLMPYLELAAIAGLGYFAGFIHGRAVGKRERFP